MKRKEGSQCVVNGKTHYERNKKYYVQRAKDRSRALKKFLSELKDVPCKDCGGRFPSYVMDFDHVDPKTKTLKLTSMMHNGWGKKRLLEEVAKCDVVCANCHRIRTAIQRGYA